MEDHGNGHVVCHSHNSDFKSTSTADFNCKNMLPRHFDIIEVPRELNHIEKRLAAVGCEV